MSTTQLPDVTSAALDLATGDDFGRSSTDNVTNITSALTIGGVAEAGSTVEFFDSAISLGSKPRPLRALSPATFR